MRRGFTLLEILLAIMILSIMTIITALVFQTIVHNWTLATEMADNMQRVDYVTAQVTYALRSAYFPTSEKTTEADGFMLLDHNENNDPDESDVISWTKLGPAIVGRNSRFARSPHRVTLFVRSERDADEEHPAGLIAQVIGEDKFRPDDFDEDDETNWDWFLLGAQVQGFNCRVLDKNEPFSHGMANWQDIWDTSNSIPRRVQLTFWMGGGAPPGTGGGGRPGGGSQPGAGGGGIPGGAGPQGGGGRR